MSQPLPEQFGIERRDNPTKQTEEREEMAEVLEEHWGSGKSLEQMAEIAGYSRQHAVNTINSHFHKVEKDESSGEITITIPGDVENPQDYLKGLTDAMEAQ